MTQEQHFDVASYALGVLDERDAARFEDHLIECPACALELESFLPVADILADVDADAMVAVEQERHDGLVLKKVIGDVRQERRRANSRRLYSLAAAVVVFAMLSIGALFVGGQVFAPDQQEQQSPTAQRSAGTAQLDPLPPDDGPGLGGPDLPGERFSGTDTRTGVRADVGLESKDWGTQVSFMVSNIKGPLTCRLVAVRTDGATETLSTWTVGDDGWGTAANPDPLMLQAVTALPREEIAHLQVQSVDAKGGSETLVRVP
ncbi:zf-HC2 domain-containing protein [Mangrovihabitans endophyticus]|uniref:RNA polymerase subunit sigma n=1 Tax=Mangrovihabitans endophyticus TaxID=1751298 RepID=A0A8J3C495_9ACTN|nr:zf-HC2 domain-containing protein [Mangrovihabitans endophyticus]GGL06327.1 RNA polymerase subunit sigma [Mangrovihabitans endophyticus]